MQGPPVRQRNAAPVVPPASAGDALQPLLFYGVLAVVLFAVCLGLELAMMKFFLEKPLDDSSWPKLLIAAAGATVVGVVIAKLLDGLTLAMAGGKDPKPHPRPDPAAGQPGGQGRQFVPPGGYPPSTDPHIGVPHRVPPTPTPTPGAKRSAGRQPGQLMQSYGPPPPAPAAGAPPSVPQQQPPAPPTPANPPGLPVTPPGMPLPQQRSLTDRDPGDSPAIREPGRDDLHEGITAFGDAPPSYDTGAMRAVAGPEPVQRIDATGVLKEIDPEPFDDAVSHPHFRYFPPGNEVISNPAVKPATLRGGWQIIGASRRGLGHGLEGKYREDDFRVQLFGPPKGPHNSALIAIADGVSSRKFSRYGAAAAAEGAVSVVAAQPRRFEQFIRNVDSAHTEVELKDPSFSNDAWSLLESALTSAQESVAARAKKIGVHPDELHSTLQVFLVVPHHDRLLVAAVQIGDGALFGYVPDGQPTQPDQSLLDAQWHYLLPPQIQEAGNEVQPFMRSTLIDWKAQFQFYPALKSGLVIGMTDGVADDFEAPPPTAETPHPSHFQNLNDDLYQRRLLPVLQSAAPVKELGDLLGYRLRGSFDDRTLVCVYQPQRLGLEAAP